MGNARWRRLTEERAGGGKSVFHFDVQGSVAKSTHAGIPWLRFIRQRLGERVHFWPFDGWSVPPNCSVVAEVYPALRSRTFPTAGLTPDQQDAYGLERILVISCSIFSTLESVSYTHLSPPRLLRFRRNTKAVPCAHV